ncbi:DUF6777 domain-containing protein [Streptomyces sp. NPDC052301]|uniref:DUF6777 domain-containing protein n=1 Tax=Streptomyces sp. NPDC052301 TaxID=3365687 RepID=UPI0037CD5AE5
MSVEPPFPGRPTGPPSGPLSGSSRPPAGPPPAQPPGGSPGAQGPQGPWWRSVPRMAALTVAVVAAVVLAIVFTRPGGGGSAGGGEVFLQPAGSAGRDPFTESTARRSSVPPPPSASAVPSGPANALQGVQGGAPGLYGGVQDTPACDVEKQVEALQGDAAKTRAFASVAGVQPSGVPAYLRSLTPVQLRVDTRVTNHGYRDGTVTAYQSVLQAGTAVLVDGHGMPRVRCASGSPLTPPVARRTAPKPVGPRWSAYRPSNVVVVTPAPTVVDVFVLYDPHHQAWFHRHRGDATGHRDQHARPPANPHPWTRPTASPSFDGTSPSAPTARTSPSSPPSPATSPPASPSGSPSTPPSSSPSSPSSPSSEEPRTPSSQSSPAGPSSPAPGSPSGETSGSAPRSSAGSSPGSAPGPATSGTPQQSPRTS